MAIDKKQLKITLAIVGVSAFVFWLIKKRIKNVNMTENEFKRLSANKGIFNPIAGRLVLTSPFGNRVRNGVNEFHNGVDLIPFDGTPAPPIVASLPGKVEAVYFNALGGNQVIINSGYATFGYAHLLKPSTLKVGEFINGGALIGYMGNTGASNGAHLHFTLRLAGQIVNPLLHLPDLRAAITNLPK